MGVFGRAWPPHLVKFITWGRVCQPFSTIGFSDTQHPVGARTGVLKGVGVDRPVDRRLPYECCVVVTKSVSWSDELMEIRQKWGIFL